EAAPYLTQAYSWGEDKFPIAKVGGRDFYAPKDVDTPEKKLGAQMFGGMRSGIDFWLKNNLAYVGSPETVIRKIQESQELIGYTMFSGRFRFGPQPDHLVRKSLRLFGEKVIPAFE